MSTSNGTREAGDFVPTRRTFLGMGVGAAIGCAAVPRVKAETSQPLTATVTLDGRSYVYREDAGTDLGDFVSDIGNFTQKCIRCDITDLPLTVFFRPDRTSDRVEVVFELGRMFSGSPANLGAYDVTIARGSQVLTSLKVPAHYWFSRWRWQSVPRPIVGKIDTLITQGLLPPYDRTGVSKTAALSAVGTAAPAAAATSTTVLNGSTLVSGKSVSGNILARGQAFQLITAQAGQRYTVTLSGAGSLFLSISDSTGKVVATNVNGTNFDASTSFLAQAGTYYAVLFSFAPTTTSYTMLLEGAAVATPTVPDDYAGNVTSSGLLAVGGTISGYLTASDRDDFKLTLKAGVPYTVFHAEGTLALPRLILRDVSGAIVAQNVPGSTVPVALAFTPATAGDFWLAVDDPNGGSGSYTLALSETGYAPPVYTIMGMAGVVAYMPQTGDRPDIGLVTEPQGKYICTENGAALSALRAQAEAAGTAPWHMRDEFTSAPINFGTYPKASWYFNPRGGEPYIPTTNSPVTVDTAHQPALAYLPYLLTGDPYHLEDLQFQATWNWGSLPYQYRPTIDQSRSFAWSLRTVAQCARVTPTTLPKWLLPRTYWSQLLGTYREYLEDYYVNSSSPVQRIFRSTASIDGGRDEGTTAPAGTWIDPWQEEFIVAVMGWVLRLGFTDWQDAFVWKAGSTVARTSKTSGWVRAFAVPYRLILRENAAAPLASDWAQAWTLTQTIRGFVVTDPDTYSDDLASLAFTRAALVFIDKQDVVNVTEPLAWASQQYKLSGATLPYRWRLGTWL